MFKKASKQQSKLRLLLEGPSGSGKTFSALTLASGLGKKIAFIDTEKGSASLYSDRFDFDVVNLMAPYTPEKFISAIEGAAGDDYDVLIIDSTSHEWNGEGGCLDVYNALGGRYQDWAKVTPRHTKFVETILKSPLHVIGTARTKADYALSAKGNGKYKVEKLGTKTEQRDGLEYEFTTVLRLNQNHLFEASKDRTNLFDGKEGILDKTHAEMLINWLNDGEDMTLIHEAKARELKEAGLKAECGAYMKANKSYISKDVINECVSHFTKSEAA
tara:strand:- start:1612 stop:2430 length:819 start_codon:yes stop_codon:yes gene_type:complete